METDIKETINKLREIEKKCLKSRYETYGNCQCQGCRYAMEQHNCLAKLEEWAKDPEKANIISKEIGISEVSKDRPYDLDSDVSRYLERMYSFETSVNRSPMFYKSFEAIPHWNQIGEMDYNRPMTTPLYQGLRDNNLDLIKEGCQQIDINELDPYGKTPLMYACAHCSLEIVKALVEDGSDVNKRDLLNWTPLFYCKDATIADYLLSRGADIKAQDYRGNNLILHNILNPAGSCALCCIPRTDLIKRFLTAGINVNAQDRRGYTALMHLVETCGNIESIKLLLDVPTIDVNIKNAEGKTALDIVKKRIDSILEYARLYHAIEQRKGTIGCCVINEEDGKDIPPRKEKPELPPIEEVELSYSDKETVKKYQDKIDLLVAHGANR